MKKYILMTIAAIFTLSSFGQAIQDFTQTDCDNTTSWTLYTELGNGKACLLTFMNTACGTCASSTSAIESIYQDYGAENSTNLRCWALDEDNGESCSTILTNTSSWGGTYPSLPQMNFTFLFYDNLYGSTGMPPLFVLIKPNTSNPDQSTVIHSRFGWLSAFEQEFRDSLIAHGHFPLGIASITADEGVHIFPNPASDQMTVAITKTGDKQVDIYNVVGQKVETVFNGHVTGQMNIKVDVSNYTAGVYFVQITEGDKVETIKITVN